MVYIYFYELLKKMYSAGCRRISYGIESGNQSLLNAIKKGFTLEQAEKAISNTKKAKIEINASFMLGLPGETKTDSLKTIDFAIKLNPDFAKFNLTVPYPGTELYEQSIKRRTINSAGWSNYSKYSSMTSNDPVYVSKTMNKKELVGLQKYAFKKFYLRPKVIIRHLLKIRSLKHIKNYIRAFDSIVR